MTKKAFSMFALAIMMAAVATHTATARPADEYYYLDLAAEMAEPMHLRFGVEDVPFQVTDVINDETVVFKIGDYERTVQQGDALIADLGAYHGLIYIKDVLVTDIPTQDAAVTFNYLEGIYGHRGQVLLELNEPVKAEINGETVEVELVGGNDAPRPQEIVVSFDGQRETIAEGQRISVNGASVLAKTVFIAGDTKKDMAAVLHVYNPGPVVARASASDLDIQYVGTTRVAANGIGAVEQGGQGGSNGPTEGGSVNPTNALSASGDSGNIVNVYVQAGETTILPTSQGTLELRIDESGNLYANKQAVPLKLGAYLGTEVFKLRVDGIEYTNQKTIETVHLRVATDATAILANTKSQVQRATSSPSVNAPLGGAQVPGQIMPYPEDGQNLNRKSDDSTTAYTSGVVVNEDCDGCEIESSCVDVGFRKAVDGEAVYCGATGDIIAQKAIGEVCENNFECQTNTCASGQCIDLLALQKQVDENTSVLARVSKWLSGWF